MKKSTLLHLRIPFSFFLLPVFLFASSILSDFNWFDFVFVGIILHLLIYPASNGYNSYFDKDEGSIGGLMHPPKVSGQLYWTALFLDILALLLGFYYSWIFVLALLLYGLVSKAYSHPAIRLKKRPFLGWLAAGIFQGYFTFLTVACAYYQNDLSMLLSSKVQLAAILSTLLLFGSYPMTQVYQHDEDAQRGDRTISILLGIRGTFLFTAAFFSLSVVLFFLYFQHYFTLQIGILFLIALIPVLVYFGWWFFKVLKSERNADYTHTMRLNLISSICLNAFFGSLILIERGAVGFFN